MSARIALVETLTCGVVLDADTPVQSPEKSAIQPFSWSDTPEKAAPLMDQLVAPEVLLDGPPVPGNEGKDGALGKLTLAPNYRDGAVISASLASWLLIS